MEQQSKDGMFSTDTHGQGRLVCPECKGTGIIINRKLIGGILEEVTSHNCTRCKRLGYISDDRSDRRR